MAPAEWKEIRRERTQTTSGSNGFNAILARLNAEQREAFETLHGPARVVSRAGTGKTTTLTLRIVNLMVKKVARAEDTLAVTFTNKAAREMRERIHKLIGDGAFR